jgi:outer membrane protein assembly factor BamB
MDDKTQGAARRRIGKVAATPIFCLAFLCWALAASPWTAARRRTALVALTVVACGAWTLVRTTGVDGDLSPDFAPRWGTTAEERFLASPAAAEPAAPTIALDAEGQTPAAAWPGLRGPSRDGVLPGVRVGADWSSTPPRVLWRHQVGPGWSSFAVAGDRLYTQEQRGDDEAVVSYDAATGEPVWLHADPARFWEAMAGAGPRATPTLSDGKVFALGATGVLNALDAADGSRLWQRRIADDTGAPVPQWGFSASPLLVDGLVVVHGGAPEGKAVVAYDAATGEPRWHAPAGPLSYSSVHETTLGGQRQRQRPAPAAPGPGPAARALGPRGRGAGEGRAVRVHRGARASTPSTARPGTIPCWSTASSTSATPSRWRR